MDDLRIRSGMAFNYSVTEVSTLAGYVPSYRLKSWLIFEKIVQHHPAIGNFGVPHFASETSIWGPSWDVGSAPQVAREAYEEPPVSAAFEVALNWSVPVGKSPKNVGKTRMNYTFGKGLNQLFMVIWGWFINVLQPLKWSST